MTDKTVLANGITVLTEAVPSFRSAAVGIFVNTGSKDETLEQVGISHIIEHMVFKGTEKRTAFQIAEEIDQIGGNINAYTSREETCFFARIMDEHVPQSLDILSDMLKNSLFNPDDIEKEKLVVLEEIDMYEDSPDELIHDYFMQNIWPSHPLSRSIIGKKEVVKSFARKDILGYQKLRYAPDNIIIAAAGGLKHEKFAELAETYFGSLQGKKAADATYQQPVFEPKKIVKFRECEQTYVCLGCGGVSTRDTRRFAFSILDCILGGSQSSRLVQEIREKRGLAYAVYSYMNSFLNDGLFTIFAGINQQNTQQVVDLIISTLDEVKEKGVTEKELVIAKDSVKIYLTLSLESTISRMFRLYRSFVNEGRFVPVEETLEKINAVTSEDIRKLTAEFFRKEQYALNVLGPFKGKIKWE